MDTPFLRLRFLRPSMKVLSAVLTAAVLLTGLAEALLDEASAASRRRNDKRPPATVQRSIENPYAGMTPMRVIIARSNDPACGSACPEWIAADGDIMEQTPAEFRRVLAKLGGRKLPVLINSRGGSVEAGIAIGRMMRSRGLDVGVAATVFDPCEGDQSCVRGRPVNGARAAVREPLGLCASSCAFILGGGSRRATSMSGHVGVHQIKAFRTLTSVERSYRVRTRVVRGRKVVVSRRVISERRIAGPTVLTEVTDATYRPVRRFLSDMGLSQDLIDLMKSTPNESIRWLTLAERQVTGLVNENAGVAPLFSGQGNGQARPPLFRAPESAEATVAVSPGWALKVTLRRAANRTDLVAALITPAGDPIAWTDGGLVLQAPAGDRVTMSPDPGYGNVWRATLSPQAICSGAAPHEVALLIEPTAEKAVIDLGRQAGLSAFARKLCARLAASP